MWDWSNSTVFTVLTIIPDNPEFNYFFTLVTVFGLLSVAVGLLVKIISRS